MERRSVPNIARIVGDGMLLQNGQKLRLEIALTMVLLLATDVGKGGVDLRMANGECAVTLLPLEGR
jgi:hypothetical protein